MCIYIHAHTHRYIYIYVYRYRYNIDLYVCVYNTCIYMVRSCWPICALRTEGHCEVLQGWRCSLAKKGQGADSRPKALRGLCRMTYTTPVILKLYLETSFRFFEFGCPCCFAGYIRTHIYVYAYTHIRMYICIYTFKAGC